MTVIMLEILRAASNPQLVQAIVRAHAWLELLTNGTYNSMKSLARSVDLHPKVIRSRIRLAFLAPNVTREFLKVSQPLLKDVNDLAASIEFGWRVNSTSLVGQHAPNVHYGIPETLCI